MHLIKRIAKITGIVVLSITMLLLLLCFIIYLPPVQKKLTAKAVTYLENKTKGHFKIGGIYLVWPLNIKIENLEIRQPDNTFVASIGSLKTNASLQSLLKKKLVIGLVELRNADAHIIRSGTDSSFNFSFITEAFAGKKSSPKVKDSSKSSFGIEFRDIHFEKITLVYKDRQSGVNADVHIGNLQAGINKNNFDSLAFDLSDLSLSNSEAGITINPSVPKPVDTTASVMPQFRVDNLNLKAIKFAYVNHTDSSLINTTIGNLAISGIDANIKNQKIIADKIKLSHSAFLQLDEHLAVEAHNAKTIIDSSANAGISLAVRKITLEENSVSLHQRRNNDHTVSFNPTRLDIIGLNGTFHDLRYSMNETGAAIDQLSFKDADRFTLSDLSGNISLKGGKVILNKVKVLTPGTMLNADVILEAASFEELKKQPGEASIELDVDADKIAGNDAIYWIPALQKITVVHIRNQQLSISANAKGRVNDLLINSFNLRAGKNTSLAFNGRLKGLPDPHQIAYAVPALKFYTTRSDLFAIADRRLFPASVNIPSAILLNGSVNGNPGGIKTQLRLGTELGGLTTSAQLIFAKDTSYEAIITTNVFNLHQLIVGDSTFGLATVHLKLAGKGFTADNAKVDYNLVIDRFDFKHYSYSKGVLSGYYDRRNISVNARFNDPALDLVADAEAGFKKDKEFFKINIDLQGANLKALNFYKDDLRIAMRADADLKGADVDHLNGKAGITRIMLIKDGQSYVLDSLLFASVNEPGKNNVKFSSSLITLDFDGNVAPGKLKQAVTTFIDRYYDISDTTVAEAQAFTFHLEVRNHPVIPAVFFPLLSDFLPAVIDGAFDNRKDVLSLKVTVPRIRYGSTSVDNFAFELSSDKKQIGASLNIRNISSGNYGLKNFETSASLHDNTADVKIHGGNKDKKSKEEDKLDLGFTLAKVSRNEQKIHVNTPVKLARKNWKVPDDNEILVGEHATVFKDFSLVAAGEEIKIESNVSQLSATFKGFNLSDLSSLITDDTLPVAGLLNGFLKLNGESGHRTMEADVRVDSMMVMQVPVGTLSAKADTKTASAFNLAMNLNGPSTDVRITGDVNTEMKDTRFDLKTKINSLNAKMLDGLSFGALKNSSGIVKGDINLQGTASKPDLYGTVELDNFTTTPSVMNTSVTFVNETITLENGQVTLNNFRIRDADKNEAVINGLVKMDGFKPGNVNMDIGLSHFKVFNTERKQNDLYYGLLNLDGSVTVKGSVNLPVINANIKIDKGSSFAFIVPESKLTTDKGEAVIVFDDTTKLSPVLTDITPVTARGSYKGMSLTSRLSVDKDASLKILIDPTAGDSLVVKGEATLALTMNPAGDISLNGLYDLTDGSYITSLQDLVQKKFQIQQGSTIRWNGDPLDADLDITAVYMIKTSPADLVAGQISGLSDAEQNQYKQRLTFNVLLKLSGKLLKPDIAFAINLADKDKGALGGSVDSKLRQVNSDPSELNKQVFALLLLNRFVQEDPLASAGGGGGEGFARTSVSKFLSAELNRMASRYVAGAELSFNVDSYDDYKSGSSQGRTQVGVALKKQFLDDRFSVQVGSNVDVEGKAAKSNKLSDITGDVLIEYKLTEDGRFRASGFRKNEYLDVLEGQVTETGVGLLYMKDFDRWKYFFKRTSRNHSHEGSNE